MRPNKPAVAMATAVLLTLAACGGGSGSGEEDSSAPQDVAEGGAAGSGKDPDAEGPVEVPEDATDGGTLNVDTIQSPTTFDPTRTYFVDGYGVLGMVTRSLTQYAYIDGEMVLVPDLATDLGRPNEDNTEWTFTIKEGIKYEDGSEVEPEDVAYAVKRSFAIEELPEGPTFNLTYFLDGDKYKGPFQDKGEYRGVEVDGQDVTIKMRRPFAEMDYYAALPAFTAIPEDKDDPETYGDHPLATGPYKFGDYKPGTSLSLVRNDQWDPDTDPGRIQALDGWEFRFGQDQAKVENVIVNDTGTAQTTLSYDSVTPSTYRLLQEEGGERLVEGTSPCTYMWYLDQTQIEEKEVRQAIGWAYPYRNAWRAAGLIEGVTRSGGTTILPPGTDGRKEYEALPGQDGTVTDPEKSKALLKEAGYAPGEYEIKFYFQTDVSTSVAAKEEIVKGLEAGGFKATPIASTSDTIRTDESNYDAPINIRSSGWCNDWPAGGQAFSAQWDGDLVGVEGMPNLSNLSEPDIQKEYDRILTLPPEEAIPAWGGLDEMIQTEYYAAVITGYDGVAMIHGSKVGGMENNNVIGLPTFAIMYVAE